jgi:Trypsin
MRLLWVLLWTGCDKMPQSRHFAITHGTADSADPAVAALLLRVSACDAPPAVFCSATLVAPRALATAAHCLDVAPLGAMVAFFGADARAPGETHAVVGAARHPDLDLAVLALDGDAAAAPIAVDSGPAPSPGESVRLSGFGADESGQVGLKRQGTAQIDSVSPSALRVVPSPALSCGGDSGGPLLHGERLAGVASFGDAACAASATYAPVPAAFIAGALAQLAPAALRPSPSDLCRAACDADVKCPLGFVCARGRCTLPGAAASAVGKVCGTDGECPGGSCVALDVGCRCVIACEPLVPSSGGCSFVGSGVARKNANILSSWRSNSPAPQLESCTKRRR